MAESKQKDEITGVETTGHEWDGIQELTECLAIDVRTGQVVFVLNAVVGSMADQEYRKANDSRLPR